MARTQVQLQLRGQDQTGQAFASVAQRANKAFAALKQRAGMLKLAAGVAGIAYASKKAIDGMADLYTHAQRAGTSADDLNRITQALDTVNIAGANTDQISNAMARMAQETGKVGAAGMKEILSDIAALGDEKDRLEELGRVFGRRFGRNLAPLVRQGPEALKQGLEGVMATMPELSTAGVNTAADVQTAMHHAGKTIKAAWWNALAGILQGFKNVFGVDLNEAITIAIADIKWFCGLLVEGFKVAFSNVKKVFDLFTTDWRAGVKWLWEGWQTFAVSLWEAFKQAFATIGRLAIEFGKQIWSAIRGDGFDWGAITETASREFTKLGKKVKGVLDAAIPSGGDLIEFEKLDWGAQVRKLRESTQKAKDGLAAQALLATGGISEGLDEAAKKAAGTIKDAMKGAMVEAGSYEHLKLMFRGAGKALAGGAVAAPSPVAGQAPQRQQSAGIDRLSTIASRIENSVQRLVRHAQRLEAW